MQTTSKVYPHEQVQTHQVLPVRFLPYSDTNRYIPNHWHNSVEIILVNEGCLEVSIHERTLQLTANHFICINSGDIHATNCLTPSQIVLLQIPYPFLKQYIPAYDEIRFEALANAVTVDARLIELLQQMCSCYNSSSYSDTEFSLLFHSLLFEFLFLLTKHYLVTVSPAVRTKTESTRARLKQIIHYVRDHYTEPVSLAEAAAIVSLNPEYFCRFFKKYMGLTFLEYVNSVRLSHIYYDLITTDTNITELLLQHGFTNYKLFIRSFRQTYGDTPSQIRKKSRLDPSRFGLTE